MPDDVDPMSQLSAYLPARIVGILIVISLIIAVAKQIQFVQGVQYLVKLIKVLRVARPVEDAQKREVFCNSLIRRLNRINDDERWQDGNYSELEAEVESDSSVGSARSTFRLLLLDDFRRRERSLSRAILESQEPLVFLRGDPGSGKSVALRHAAIILAKRAATKRSKSPIPIYITLRELEPKDIVSYAAFRTFVINSMRSLEDIRQLDYFASQYDDLVARGRLLFLLDGFDEIVEVLSTTEADSIVMRYQDFLEGYIFSVSPCRAVIASREYRGPLRKELPQFTIIPLDARHRESVVRKRRLDDLSRRRLDIGLATATSDIHSLATNSMFMGLLCEYVQFHDHFPTNTDEVFRAYVDDRLEIAGRHLGIDVDTTVSTAQLMAYAMLASSRLGLTATIEDITSAIALVDSDAVDIGGTIRALRQTRLARSDSFATTDLGPPLTFSHRRFQEFFATGYLLDHPDVVSDRNLLLQGHWRESAVTILQHRESARVVSLIGTAISLLEEMDVARPGAPLTERALEAADRRFSRFSWPPHSLHLLDLLDAGLPLRDSDQIAHLRVLISRIVFRAFAYGGTADKKWALDGASKVAPGRLAVLFRNAFEGGSQLLRDAAFQQIGRLYPVPNDIERHIVRGLLTMSASGDLAAQATTLNAQVSRLEDSRSLTNALRLLRLLPGLDLLANCLLAGALFTQFTFEVGRFSFVTVLLLVSSVTFVFFRMSKAISWTFSGSDSTLRRIAQVDAVEATLGLLFLIARACLIGLAWIVLPPVMAVVGTYVLVWAPSAVICLRLGGLARLPLWFVPSGYALFAGARSLLLALSVRWILAAVAILTGMNAVALVGVWAIAHPESPLSTALFWAFAGLVALMGVILLFGLALGVRGAVRCTRDLLLLQSLISKPPKQVSPEDFLRLMGSFRTSLAMTKAMIVLRKSSALKNSPEETTALLRELPLLDRWMLPLTKESIKEESTRKQADVGRRLRLQAFATESPALAHWIQTDPKLAAALLVRANQQFWDQCGLSTIFLRPT